MHKVLRLGVLCGIIFALFLAVVSLIQGSRLFKLSKNNPADHNDLKLSSGKTETKQKNSDQDLIQMILSQSLDTRRFKLEDVIYHSTGKSVIPFDSAEPTHENLKEIILKIGKKSLSVFSASDSPVRSLRRINEASKLFEDFFLKEFEAYREFSCSIPTNTRGSKQRAGYPDLLIIHIPSQTKAYLDLKLYQNSSEHSSFRSFYYEPKSVTSKIHFNAMHLLLGVSHNGQDSEWSFEQVKLIDLAKLEVRLKAEFQSSNKQIYTDQWQIK